MTYANVQMVKAAMSLGPSDTVDDTAISTALDAACAAIDGYCGRSFDVAGTAATSRIYAASVADLVYIDDATSITLVETDPNVDGTWATTWTTNDWQAEPLNGRDGARTVPYTRIAAVGNYAFPVERRACVRVTATWGWAAVPEPVTQAAVQMTLRLWKRLDTPLGFGGGPDTGLLYVSRQIDGDVAQMLAPYRIGVAAWGGFA